MIGELGAAPDFDRTGVLGVHAPVGAVDVMRAPTSDHACAELAAAQPAGTAIALGWMDSIEGVVDVWSFAKPHLVVEAIGDRHGGLVAAGRVAGEADFNAFQRADAAVADELRCVSELDGGALLAADLEDAAGGLDSIGHGAAFGDGERSGLLQVDVFAGANGIDGDERVPVVGRADEDGVDVFVCKQVVIVGVACDAIVGLAELGGVGFVDELFAIFDTIGVEVANGDDAGIVYGEDVGHVMDARDAPHADGADVDLLAGRVLAEKARRNNGREAGDGGGGKRGFEERAT